jgi:hypothetical protein
MSSTNAAPEMLTVPEAARVLRIGRTLAYQLTSRFLDGEPDGLPVVRLGNCLRVPRWALDELMHRSPIAPAEAASGAAENGPRVAAAGEGRVSRPRARRVAKRGSAQLSLLEVR